MSANCCTSPPVATVDPTYRRILWIALVANAAMFFVEIGASAFAESTALLADAVDFFGDAANYGISLAVLALLTNVGVAFMLFRYYSGDAKMRSSVAVLPQ